MNKRLEIILGDITKQKTDAIVNAANTSLRGGGGVDGAIHRAAGPQLLEECKKLNGCAAGEAKITHGYRLPARYVIHTPGPIWRGGKQQEAELLANCYRNCLRLAVEHDCQSISFPSISTGVYRFPLEQAAAIAMTVITKFLSENQQMQKVFMVCFDEKTTAAYQKALEESTELA
ncbi:MAG: O-acetyl-ADP-ribose deacetylase [Bacillota bacterium]|jgi:O-acetyl-ADP-ribose deacetylase (regulator of RNase III)